MTPHVLVIGGGHNGLVAANYLALTGHRVTLIEQRERLGGVVGRFDYLPGYSSSITNSPGSFEGIVMQELQLQDFGLRFHRPETTLLHPMDDGLFIGWREPRLLEAQMERMAAGESARHRALVSRLDRLGEDLGLSLWERPQDQGSVLERMAPGPRAEFRRTMIDGSLHDLLDESLRSPQVKSLMMMLALNGQLLSPRAPGSAFGLMLRPISRASGDADVLGIRDAPLRGSVGLPVGSMSAIVDALETAARVRGVAIRTGAGVAQLEFDDAERVTAAVLETGEAIEQIDAVVSTVEASRLHRMIPDSAIPGSAWPAAPDGSAFKIALALDGLPSVAGAPDGIPEETLLSTQFRIGPNPEYITEAVEDGIAGRPSGKPIIWGLIPSLTSPGLAPEGRHLMSLNVWHAPHRLGEAYWQRHGAAFADRCIAQLETAFPGLSDRITDRRWLGPHELEREFGLTASNITHGDMTPQSMLNGRPDAGLSDQLERAGIVLGGAESWPGGYVTGIPGRRAALTIARTKEAIR
ncbi:NAD(P)/FAD-dependent oxidoreductase [Leucobacter allii]|uniref:phytoene desaturase family protein n=1 Tax=Leucobacter allii TaxID=2932247 RepID=UPI001FD5BD1A|nr:NAD(P)/FAD-dependent oxidoreductase [Leucobacter allii]UOR02486.1 NAD(P)/FAD-dependent oxidoreductase [Leucobacter allii]